MKRNAGRDEEDVESEDKGEDEDEAQVICRHTLSDTGNYRFAVTLSAHYEFESVVVLSVDIHHGQSKAGSLTGLVIDRSFRPRPRWTFHELCDAQSRELQQMGVCFCNNDGTLRYADLDGLDAKNDSAANWGGFLQIELVSISEEHRHKDLGVRCVTCWEYITKEVRGYEVYKSFVGGWCQIFEALREIISPRGTLSPALPTVDAVMRELYQGRRRYDERYLSFFFSNGGKVEHAIDGLLHETADSDVFFDIFGYEEEDGSLEEEYNALPEHPLDDVWDFVRYNILGPKGRVPKGPF